ncbi:hypothetical protein BC827DRAFT_1229711, partial [Russula dissimulans]
RKWMVLLFPLYSIECSLGTAVTFLRRCHVETILGLNRDDVREFMLSTVGVIRDCPWGVEIVCKSQVSSVGSIFICGHPEIRRHMRPDSTTRYLP